jgi:hypothetical protein
MPLEITNDKTSLKFNIQTPEHTKHGRRKNILPQDTSAKDI